MLGENKYQRHINKMISDEVFYLIVKGVKVWCRIKDGKLLWYQTLEQYIEDVKDGCSENHEYLDMYPTYDTLTCAECEEDEIEINNMFDKGEL